MKAEEKIISVRIQRKRQVKTYVPQKSFKNMKRKIKKLNKNGNSKK